CTAPPSRTTAARRPSPSSRHAPPSSARSPFVAWPSSSPSASCSCSCSCSVFAGSGSRIRSQYRTGKVNGRAPARARVRKDKANDRDRNETITYFSSKLDRLRGILIPFGKTDPLAHRAAVDLLVDQAVGLFEQVPLAVEEGGGAVIDGENPIGAERG